MALACALVVLFPVISATDDLHAMRAEMEESPISKRTVSHKNIGKSFSWKSHSQVALIVAAVWLAPLHETRNSIRAAGLFSPAPNITSPTSRGPPLPKTA
jgi:hypothetical protein